MDYHSPYIVPLLLPDSQIGPDRSMNFLRDPGTINSYPTSHMGSWRLASVPASDIDSISSPWYQAQEKGGIYKVGKHNEDAYEIAIDLCFLPWLLSKKLPMELDHTPIQLKQGVKALYGTQHAKRQAATEFLQRAAQVLRSPCPPGVKEIYRQFAREHHLHERLDRLLLSYDISVSSPFLWLQQSSQGRHLILKACEH